MKKEREELRRGIRSFIQDASAELAEFTGAPAPQPGTGQPERRDPTPADRPILRLVREPAKDAPEEESAVKLDEMTLRLPKKGVCAAYFINKQCWEIADAYCNHALHICRLRECPVYALHHEAMEQRYAKRFKHLW
ncbi:MAG TPA: hypothetical protein VGK88_12975 [bacterium]|jgi:hypothetical protein